MFDGAQVGLVEYRVDQAAVNGIEHSPAFVTLLLAFSGQVAEHPHRRHHHTVALVGANRHPGEGCAGDLLQLVRVTGVNHFRKMCGRDRC